MRVVLCKARRDMSFFLFGDISTAKASPPAAELADVLVQRMEQETSVSPKATSYSAAISACAKFGDFVRALSLYSRALERGQANAVVLGATVAACRAAAERAADPQTAAKAADAAVATLLRALPALSSSTTTANTTTHDLPLRGFVYRDAVLAVCAPQCPPSADRALAAERVRRKAAARGVDVGRRARNSLLLLLASSGQWRVGAMLLREASRDGGGANSAAEERLTRPSVAATTAVVRAVTFHQNLKKKASFFIFCKYIQESLHIYITKATPKDF